MQPRIRRNAVGVIALIGVSLVAGIVVLVQQQRVINSIVGVYRVKSKSPSDVGDAMRWHFSAGGTVNIWMVAGPRIDIIGSWKHKDGKVYVKFFTVDGKSAELVPRTPDTKLDWVFVPSGQSARHVVQLSDADGQLSLLWDPASREPKHEQRQAESGGVQK